MKHTLVAAFATLTDANRTRGDLMARIVVTLPEVMDDELLTFAADWRERRPYKPGR